MAAEVLDVFARIPEFDRRGRPLPPRRRCPGSRPGRRGPRVGRRAIEHPNANPSQPLDCVIWLPGRAFTGTGQLTTLTGATADSFNDVTHPDDVRTSVTAVPGRGDTCRVRVGPHSVNILQIQTTPQA